jgi:hypothetical protein
MSNEENTSLNEETLTMIAEAGGKTGVIMATVPTRDGILFTPDQLVKLLNKVETKAAERVNEMFARAKESLDERNVITTAPRTRDFITGVTRNGVAEVLRLHDDGYRIRVTWLSGRPLNVSEDDSFMWAEYKFCDSVHLQQVVADQLFLRHLD